LSTPLRYTVVEYREQEDGSFYVRYAVKHQSMEDFEFHEILIPYNGEEPQLFLNKLRNFMIAQLAFIHNKRQVQSAMKNFAFSDPTIDFTLGVKDVT
jgi:hypothetical protein